MQCRKCGGQEFDAFGNCVACLTDQILVNDANKKTPGHKLGYFFGMVICGCGIVVAISLTLWVVAKLVMSLL